MPKQNVTSKSAPNESEAERARKLKKAVDLDNYENFDVHTWSEYPEVNAAVDALFDELKGLDGQEKVNKRHIKVIVLDLYVNYTEDPSRWVRFYRNEAMYRAKSRYNKLHSSKKTIRIVDALFDQGYLEQVKGIYGRTRGNSYMSRMRAKPELIDLLEKAHNVQQHMVELAPDKETIILRKVDPTTGKKTDKEYTDTTDTNRMRKDVIVYNNLLRRTSLDIIAFPPKGLITGKRKKGKKRRRIYLKRNKKFVRRVFSNGTFDDGGRFHGGWWQRIPKEWRAKIRIDGLPTVELDYSGLHIVLLYHIEKIDYWKNVGTDPYKLPGIEQSERMRRLLKQVLLSSINAKDKKNAEKGIQHGIYKDLKNLGWAFEEKVNREALIDAFAKHHAPIAKYFFTGHGIKLQNIDADIAEHVINHFTQKDVPVLCIHDSFVIQATKEAELLDVMEKAFQKAVLKIRGTSKATASKIKVPETVDTNSEFADQMKMKELRKKPSYVNMEKQYGRRLQEHADRLNSKDWVKDYYRNKDKE